MIWCQKIACLSGHFFSFYSGYLICWHTIIFSIFWFFISIWLAVVVLPLLLLLSITWVFSLLFSCLANDFPVLSIFTLKQLLILLFFWLFYLYYPLLYFNYYLLFTCFKFSVLFFSLVNYVKVCLSQLRLFLFNIGLIPIKIHVSHARVTFHSFCFALFSLTQKDFLISFVISSLLNWFLKSVLFLNTHRLPKLSSVIGF